MIQLSLYIGKDLLRTVMLYDRSEPPLYWNLGWSAPLRAVGNDEPANPTRIYTFRFELTRWDYEHTAVYELTNIS